MKIDEYKVSTLYTSAALAASAAYSLYDHQLEVPERNETRDMVVGFLYASVLSVFLSFSKQLRHRSLVSLASLGLWLGRLIAGVMISSYSDMYRGEDNSIIYWSITVVGALSSFVSLIGQYLRGKKIRREMKEEVTPVKLRFVV